MKTNSRCKSNIIPRADPDFTPNDLNPGTPCQIATYKAADSMKTRDLKILNLFAEATDMKMENKLKYMRLVVKQGWEEWISFEGFKKQLSTMSAAEVGGIFDLKLKTIYYFLAR